MQRADFLFGTRAPAATILIRLTPMTTTDTPTRLRALAAPTIAVISARFFKTSPAKPGDGASSSASESPSSQQDDLPGKVSIGKTTRPVYTALAAQSTTDSQITDDLEC